MAEKVMGGKTTHLIRVQAPGVMNDITITSSDANSVRHTQNCTCIQCSVHV